MVAKLALSHSFVLQHPDEAARVLEQLAMPDVAALLQELSPVTAGAVLDAMMPRLAAACLGNMEVPQAARILAEIPVNSAARIHRLLNTDQRKQVARQLGARFRNRMRKVLDYAALSAGDLMNPNVDMLTQNLLVADALRRIERYRQAVKCEIYVVDQQHRLVGVVETGVLLSAGLNVRLRQLLSRNVVPVSVYTANEKLISHAGWDRHLRLPVVDGEQRLVGILDYAQVKGSLRQEVAPHDPIDNLVSIAGLYWLSLLQLLDSLLSNCNRLNQ